MTGAQLGDRVLVLSCGDGGLLAALAARVGLTGHAAAVDPDARARHRATRAAAKAGVVAEITDAPFTHLPYEAGTFDLVVARDLIGRLRPEERVRCLQEVYRVIRPGGRCLVIEPAVRGGLGALIGRRERDPVYMASGGAVPALQAEGFRAARVLAEREGLRFVEATKPRL